MPRLGPLKRRDLIRAFHRLGWDGPYHGSNHAFMVRGTARVRIPNPHRGDVSGELVRAILDQAGISRDEWERV